MKKFYLMLAAVLTGYGSIMAGTTWQTQKLGEVKVDTLYHATVGPGTTQTQIRISYTRGGADATSTVTYTTTDLTNEYVTIKMGRASKLRGGAAQRVGKMMEDRTSYMNHYFVGINGDFFGASGNSATSCGAAIENGLFVNEATTLSDDVLSDYLVIDKNGAPTIADDIKYSGWVPGYQTYEGDFGTVTYPNGKVDGNLRINANQRWENYLVGYNEYFLMDGDGKQHGYTGQNQWGAEASLLPVDGNVIYGNEAEFKVGEVSSAGNMRVPEGGLVLSANGTPRSNVDALKKGDIVKIKIPFQADGKDMSARDVIGGFPITVKDGVVQELPSKVPGDIAASTPRARTAAGYNADKTKFIMAVVQEENSKGLNGMKIVEFGDVLASLGCSTAINFDGGGSAVMFVENLGQRSDVQGIGLGGYTRPVVNGLFAVNAAPEDGEVARIEFMDKSLFIQPGRGYQPVIYAYNQYGTLISTGLQNYELSAPKATFDATGRKMIAPAEGKFALTATYNGCTATIPVYVDANGIEGSDPATAPSFEGDEFVPVLKDPNAPLDPSERIYAELEDVTPAGYDFDKYEVGTKWKFAELPSSSTSGTWTAPAGIYKQENMDADGHVTAFHVRGVAMDQQDAAVLADNNNGFTVQKHPNELVGNCLVYTRQWSPGNSVYSWPNSTNNSGQYQLTFYADASKIKNAVDAQHPVRFRMVFQILYRGRHDQSNSNEIGAVYASAAASSVWALSYNGEGDNDTGAKFPIAHTSFYRWENEGTTIAGIPEEKNLLDGTGTPEPWDGDNTTNPYLINGDRFMVYEYDMYGIPANGTIAVHVNFNTTPWVTFVFKEIKFYNVLNGEELLTQPRASRAANAAEPFTTNTAYGSLLGTRHISYRYYTEDGVKEFESETSGIDDVVVDTDDSDAPVEYYNLQGVRVENPANGLYIKKQGHKATKVLIKN